MTPWQIIIIAALFFTCGLAIGWLIGEAHGWFRRQKFEEAKKVGWQIAMGNWQVGDVSYPPEVVFKPEEITPPAYEK